MYGFTCSCSVVVAYQPLRSVVVVIPIAALQPMYLCPPHDAPEVIRAVRNSKIAIEIVIAVAVVIAVPHVSLARLLAEDATRDLLVEATAPVIVPL
jgi:hypothetical protein